MLRPLSFIAVRQQQHDAAVLSPLGAVGHDELVDDRLRHVYEVTELRFPQRERISGDGAESVLKRQHGGLRERRVENLEHPLGAR